MATGSNPFDFAGETLAELLAKVVSDGTYADLLTALKVDAPGSERAASAINLHVGQLWGNAMDDHVHASYPHTRNVALGNGGLVHTTGAAKTGAYTALPGELVRYNASGGTFTVEVPASPADNTRFGIVEVGNDGTEITIDGGAAAVIGPGGTSGTTILVGEARGTLTWEFNSADSTWSLVSEAGAAAGGGASALAATLAVGDTVDDGQEINYSAGFTKVPAPRVQAREVSFASGGANAKVNVGAMLFSHDTTTSVDGDTVVVTAEGEFHISNGTNATTTRSTFKLSQEIAVSSSGAVVTEMLEAYGKSVADISFATDTSGSLRNLFMKVDEGGTTPRTVRVTAKITVTAAISEAS